MAKTGSVRVTVDGHAKALLEELGHATEALRRLSFRPERSRPVWRNKHTGTEVVVVDLAVNDHGGFQGGCRQHVVITNEPPPPGPPPPRRDGARGANVHSLWSWLEHWAPTGEHVDWPEA